MTSDQLTIQPVSTSRHWKDFFSLRRSIYRHDPAVVFPLKKMERMQLDVERNPFYQHATREPFLCYQNEKPVGRIVAIKDDLHHEYYQDQTGFFGFFEVVDDLEVVRRLIDAATRWLTERGCDRIRGPVNPSMKSDFGILTAGHADPAMVMLAHTPERYRDHLLEVDFNIIRTFHAYAFYLNSVTDHQRENWRQVSSRLEQIKLRYPQLKLRQVSAENYETTLRQINELGNQVRRDGWGFVPLTEPELDFMIRNLRQVIRFDMIRVAYWNDQLVGYIVNIPDVNWAFQKTWGKSDWLRMIQLPWLIRNTPRTRVIALGVNKKFRSKGVAMLLIQELLNTRHEFEQWEFSWVDANNQNSIRAINRFFSLDQYKTWQLFERQME